MFRNIVSILLIIVSSVGVNAQIRVLPGANMDMGYHSIKSPETQEHDFDRKGGAYNISIGPKVDIGNVNYRVVIEGHGTYMTNENLVSIFLKSDYKARRSLGYGASITAKITPWESKNITFQSQIGKKTRTTQRTNNGFAIGAGWENMKTFYKIPKESDIENTRFNMYYGQIGYAITSSVGAMDIYFRYGRGENNASFWGLGINAGINF